MDKQKTHAPKLLSEKRKQFLVRDVNINRYIFIWRL